MCSCVCTQTVVCGSVSTCVCANMCASERVSVRSMNLRTETWWIVKQQLIGLRLLSHGLHEVSYYRHGIGFPKDTVKIPIVKHETQEWEGICTYTVTARVTISNVIIHFHRVFVTPPLPTTMLDFGHIYSNKRSAARWGATFSHWPFTLAGGQNRISAFGDQKCWHNTKCYKSETAKRVKLLLRLCPVSLDSVRCFLQYIEYIFCRYSIRWAVTVIHIMQIKCSLVSRYRITAHFCKILHGTNIFMLHS